MVRPEQSPSSKLVLYSRLFLVGYALTVAWCIYRYVILPSGLFLWDQAGHAVAGALIAEDINQGAWLSLLYDLYRQVYWPPIHPSLLSIAFTLGQSTPIVARTLSLIMFLGSAPLLYLAGLKLTDKRGHLVAFIATIFFLTSPALTPYAGQVMLEMTAIFFLILTLLIFFTIDENSSASRRIALGLSITAIYFSRTNYGVLVMIVLAIEMLLEARFRPKKLFSRANLLVLLPILIAFALWFAYPPKIQGTWASLVNIPFGTAETFSLEGFLFYPKAMLQYSGNVFFAIIFFASFVVAIIEYKNRNLRFLALLIIVTLLIGQFHHTKLERHLLPVLPALFLCAGYALATQRFDFEVNHRTIKFSVPIAIVALIYAQVLFLTALKPVSTWENHDVVAYLSEIVTDEKSSLIIGTINLTNPGPTLIDWSLISAGSLLAPVHSDVAMNYDQDGKIAALVAGDRLPPWLADRIRAVAERSRQPARVRTLYLGHSDSSYSKNPAALSSTLQEMSKEELFERVIVLIPADIDNSFTISGRSPYTLDFITPGLESLGLVSVSSQLFEESNTRVDVYE